MSETHMAGICESTAAQPAVPAKLMEVPFHNIYTVSDFAHEYVQ